MITKSGETQTITYSDVAFFAADLFISEYIEGSSNNKALEIYNGTGQEVDLTGYKLALYSNGSSTYGNNIDLSGVIAQGDVYVVSNSGAAAEILAVDDISSTVTYFNGDDAIALLKNDIVIDTFGIIGTDPGSSWTVGTGATAEYTLVRKSYVFGPTTSWDPTEWDVFPQDTFSYLGSHSTEIIIPTSISVTGDSAVMEGLSVQLSVEFAPLPTSKELYWISSNDSVATVDDNGVVTGVSEGTVSITAFSKYNHSVLSSHTVTVTTPVTYTVYYEENGGTTVPDEVGILSGTLATEPTPPTKANYQFNGWYIDSFFDVLFDFDNDVVTEDITLYAEWLELFTVTFDSNGGSTVVSQEVADGQLATLPSEPTKSGYILDGWFTLAEGGVQWNFATDVITSDITLYAQWSSVSSGSLMIYEVYGGGGNSGSTYTNDYIVLYNSTSSSIDLTGYSVQYASATGTTWSVTTLSGSIAAGDFYLIQQAKGSGGTTALPTPDAIGTIAMAGTAGKVALVNSTTALTGSNPSASPSVIDFVGYGTTANGFEGTGPTPAPSNTNSVQRITFIDTNDNKNDFTAVATDLSYLE